MSNFNKATITSAAALIGTALILFSAGTASAAPTSSLKPGDKCTVTAGDNKGETGTYGSDGWCEGDWGGTECGTTKCKIKALRFVIGNTVAFGTLVQPATSTDQTNTTPTKRIGRFGMSQFFIARN